MTGSILAALAALALTAPGDAVPLLGVEGVYLRPERHLTVAPDRHPFVVIPRWPGSYRFDADGPLPTRWVRQPEGPALSLEGAVDWATPRPLRLTWSPFGVIDLELARWSVRASAAAPPSLPARADTCVAEAAGLRWVGVADPERANAACLRLARLQIRGACPTICGIGQADPGAAMARCATVARAGGTPTAEVGRLLASAYYDVNGRRYARAEATLRQAERVGLAEGVWGAAGFVGRLRGALLARQGRTRAAEAALVRAIAVLKGARLMEYTVLANGNLANLLDQRGQYDDAVALFLDTFDLLDWVAADKQPTLLHNLAWTLLAGRGAGHFGAAAGPVIEHLEAMAATRYEAAGQTGAAADTYLNRAWNAHLDADLDRARAMLGEWRARYGDQRDYNSLFARLLEGGLLAEEGQCAEAWGRFADVARAAGHDALSEPAWQAREGFARAADCAGAPDAALAYRYDALAAIDQIAAHTEVTAGRGRFFESKRGLVDQTLSSLLARGLHAEAWWVANAVQARVVRSLRSSVRVDQLDPEARGRWLAARTAFEQARQRYQAMLALCDFQGAADPACQPEPLEAAVRKALDDAYAVLDEAAPVPAATGLSVAETRRRLPEGAAVLLFAEVGDQRGTFWLDAARLDFAPVGANPLAPWHGRLAETDTLYVVSGGAPEAARLTAATGPDGALVLARTLIAYLPHVGALPAEDAPRPSGAALVVADPTGDLPEAHRQGTRLATRLKAGTALIGLDASASAVRDGLRAGPRVFHFAGHGVVDPDAPWKAHLRLADGQRLSLADVIMGDPGGVSPGLVVLDGCDTGLSLRLGRYDAVGLPEAFLLAGARTVLATLEPIADGASAAFLERFYALGGAERPGQAFREAALASAAAGDDVWRDFYLVGRPR